MKKIAFFFFAALGAAHFLFGMLAAASLLMPASLFAARILYAPFLLASITYAYTILKEHLLNNNKSGKTLDYAFAAIGIIALAFSIFLEVYFPDKPVI